MNLKERKSTLLDDKYMLSQDELLGKKTILQENNFRTQEHDQPYNTSVYNSIGGENDPRAMMAFIDQNPRGTIQLLARGLDNEIRINNAPNGKQSPYNYLCIN